MIPMADRRLQVFYTVAKQLSFTKAAEQLFMTQPAVTFQVKQLEEHFNTRLFERSHGRIALTPAGRLVLEYAERILALSEEMDTRVGELTGAVAGPLLLGASTTIAEFILPQILGEFKARASRSPGAHDRRELGDDREPRRRSHDRRRPDRVAVVPAEPAERSVLRRRAGAHLRARPCARASARRSSAQDIAAMPMVRREPGSGTREFTDNYLRQCGVAPEDLNLVMELGSPEAMKGVVETGIAVAIVSRATIAQGAQARIARRRAACAAAHAHPVGGASEGKVPLAPAHDVRRFRDGPHARARCIARRMSVRIG